MNFYVGAIVGFRSWRIVDTDLCGCVIRGITPEGMSHPYRWLKHSRTEAVCESRSHLCEGENIPHEGSPHPDCSCGLYAWNDLNTALSNFVSHPNSIVGAAVFWGKISGHVDGFRAQYARPVAMVKERDGYAKARYLGFKQALDKVRAEYQIPVVELEDLSDYAFQFGQRNSDFPG